MVAAGQKAGCTYPGPSVVMIGFRPSFFLFLFIAELPLADAAGDAVALCGGFCANVSFVCCAPFIVREREANSQAHRRGSGDGGRARVAGRACCSREMPMGPVGGRAGSDGGACRRRKSQRLSRQIS
jgi:hypothetical protein